MTCRCNVIAQTRMMGTQSDRCFHYRSSSNRHLLTLRCCVLPIYAATSMGSSKGKPTDPKLREKVVEGMSDTCLMPVWSTIRDNVIVRPLLQMSRTNRTRTVGERVRWRLGKEVKISRATDSLASPLLDPAGSINFFLVLQPRSQKSTRSKAATMRTRQAPRTSQRREHLSLRAKMVCFSSALFTTPALHHLHLALQTS